MSKIQELNAKLIIARQQNATADVARIQRMISRETYRTVGTN